LFSHVSGVRAALPGLINTGRYIGENVVMLS